MGGNHEAEKAVGAVFFLIKLKARRHDFGRLRVFIRTDDFRMDDDIIRIRRKTKSYAGRHRRQILDGAACRFCDGLRDAPKRLIEPVKAERGLCDVEENGISRGDRRIAWRDAVFFCNFHRSKLPFSVL